MSAMLLLTTIDSFANAKKIATTLLTKKLCACVNIIDNCHSMYLWQGKIEESAEQLLLIKTDSEIYHLIESEIAKIHPYKLPEIIALDIAKGLPKYLDWIKDNVSCSA